jgi:hypothetical protein
VTGARDPAGRDNPRGRGDARCRRSALVATCDRRRVRWSRQPATRADPEAVEPLPALLSPRLGRQSVQVLHIFRIEIGRFGPLPLIQRRGARPAPDQSHEGRRGVALHRGYCPPDVVISDPTCASWSFYLRRRSRLFSGIFTRTECAVSNLDCPSRI